MKQWHTYIMAISPLTGELTKFEGPKVPAPSAKLAQEWCNTHDMGYCIVEDQIAYEVSHRVDNN